jgi:hypothetical protein
MTDQTTTSAIPSDRQFNELASQFQSASEKKQLQLIPELINAGSTGETVLREFLLLRQSTPPDLVVGKAYQTLYKLEQPTTKEFLQTHFPTGVVPLRSEKGVDYTQLQQLLIDQDFQAADYLTLQKLCQMASPEAVQRKWLYFTDVECCPVADLQTINTLWLVYSEGKFGFSVQRELWLVLGKNWEKLWKQIGWKTGNNWTRYPNGFTWDISAPKGHLPLSNQLRGVRVIAALLAHPAWTTPESESV